MFIVDCCFLGTVRHTNTSLSVGRRGFYTVVPALGRPGRNREFKANLGYISRFNIKSNSDLLYIKIYNINMTISTYLSIYSQSYTSSVGKVHFPSGHSETRCETKAKSKARHALCSLCIFSSSGFAQKCSSFQGKEDNGHDLNITCKHELKTSLQDRFGHRC